MGSWVSLSFAYLNLEVDGTKEEARWRRRGNEGLARARELTASSLRLSQVLVVSLDWGDPRSRMIPTGTLSHCLSFQFTREDETKDSSRTFADRTFSFSPLVPEGQHRIETQGNQLHAWAPTRQLGSVPRFVLLQPSSHRSSSLEEIDSNLPSTKMRC